MNRTTIRALLIAALLVAIAACTPLHSPIPQPNPPPSDCYGTSTTLQYVFHRDHPADTGILGTLALKCQRVPKHYLMATSLQYSETGRGDWKTVISSQTHLEFDDATPPVLGHTYYLYSHAVCLDGITLHWRFTQTYLGESSSGVIHPHTELDFPDAQGWKVTCGSKHEAYHP